MKIVILTHTSGFITLIYYFLLLNYRKNIVTIPHSGQLVTAVILVTAFVIQYCAGLIAIYRKERFKKDINF